MLKYSFAQYSTLLFKKLIFTIYSFLAKELRESVFFNLGRDRCYAYFYINSKKIKPLSLCLLLCLSCACAIAQVFQQAEYNFAINHSYLGGYLGGGVSTFDFDNDGLDDLTLPSGESGSKFLLNNGDNFENQEFLNLSSSVRSIIWVDYDNDGDNDISLTEQDGLFRLFKNDGAFNFQEIDFGIIDNTPTFNSGISWGDYDNDGLLDAYVTRYPSLNADEIENKTNLLIKNLGNDIFLDVTIDLGVGNGLKHSFISTRVDLDNDNDLDLYVVNDRFEFPNATFLNNADGTFTEVTDTNGADLAILAMTSTIDDYDNDADFDIYCTNTFTGNHLLQNDGSGIFTNLFGNSGLELFRFSWGANWIDYQNDGWKDLFVSVGEFNTDNSNAFFSNNQTGGFNDISLMLLDSESRDSHGCAKGDFNNDGLYDLVISNEAPDFSRVLLNNSGTTNNHIKVTLEGVYSNRNAVGSKIYAFINGAVQTYFTTCGSNYISQDSQHTIIGTGSYNYVDSLLITWPSGLLEKYYNLPENSSSTFLEGETLAANIIPPSSYSICPGEILSASLNLEGSSIIWNNGQSTWNLEITEPGEYWATCFVANGIPVHSDTLIIYEHNSPILEEIETIDVDCFGVNNGQATFQFTSTEGDSIFDYTIPELYSGYYNHIIELEGLCNAQVEYTINQPPQIFTEITSIDYPCAEGDLGSVIATSFGGVLPYVYGQLDSLTIGPNVISTTDANGCNYSFDFYLDVAPETDLELEITHQIDAEFGSVTSTNSEIVLVEVIGIDSIIYNANELEAGTYNLIYLDSFGCSYNEEFTIDLLNDIDNYKQNKPLLLYPNPCYEALYLNYFESSWSISICNVQGKEIKSIPQPQTPDNRIDFTNFKPGIFIIKFNRNQETLTRKIIKI